MKTNRRRNITRIQITIVLVIFVAFLFAGCVPTVATNSNSGAGGSNSNSNSNINSGAGGSNSNGDINNGSNSNGDINNGNNSGNSNSNNNGNGDGLGDLRGYGDNPYEAVRYNARYAFEQIVLPSTVRGHEKEMLGYINDSNLDLVDNVVRTAWDYSAGITLLNILSPEEKKYTDQGKDQYFEVIDQKRIEYDLGSNHIADVTIEKLDGGANIAVVKMLEMDWYLLCTYIGIVQDQDANLRYFTIERTYDDEKLDGPLYMFCYINAPGNRGSIGLIDNDKEAFMNAINKEL